jgi:hypothetical protein
MFDDHHPAGRSNSTLTIPIPVNAHRARLSVEQYDWPSGTLRNRNKSPLLASAACVRGFIETVTYLMDELLGWIPPMLEELDQVLTRHLGPKWWYRTRWKGCATKR